MNRHVWTTCIWKHLFQAKGLIQDLAPLRKAATDSPGSTSRHMVQPAGSATVCANVQPFARKQMSDPTLENGFQWLAKACADTPSGGRILARPGKPHTSLCFTCVWKIGFKLACLYKIRVESMCHGPNQSSGHREDFGFNALTATIAGRKTIPVVAEKILSIRIFCPISYILYTMYM